MDEFIYNIFSKYFNALEQTGYLSSCDTEKLLLLVFYRDFVFEDYRGKLSKEDYHYIEKALDCLYGSTCLIPYPDYLKMGKLYLGEITEMAQRVKVLEDSNVLKVIHNLESIDNPDSTSDVIIMADED